MEGSLADLPKEQTLSDSFGPVPQSLWFNNNPDQLLHGWGTLLPQKGDPE